MVAVGGRSRNGTVPVTLAAGDEASGLANMIGQYIEQILSDSPEKRAEAAALRGRLGLLAREGGVAVTIAFGDAGVVIEEGLHDPDAIISGEVEYLMHLLAGRINPVREIRGGHMTILQGLRRPVFAYQTYHLMRLPGVHLWSGMPRPPTKVIVGAAALTVAIVVWRARSAHKETSDA